MDGKAAVRQQMTEMHRYLELAIGDCPPDLLATQLPGATINSIGAIYAHTIFSEDGMLNVLVRGEAPIYHKGGWAQKIRIEMPQGGLERDWDVNMDLGLFRQYAEDVHRSMDEYLASATDADWGRIVEPGFGPPMPVSTLLGNALLWRVATHQGEISALKGVQGMNGLAMTH